MEVNKYVIALDQGTTSSRAMIVDQDAKVISTHKLK